MTESKTNNQVNGLIDKLEDLDIESVSSPKPTSPKQKQQQPEETSTPKKPSKQKPIKTPNTVPKPKPTNKHGFMTSPTFLRRSRRNKEIIDIIEESNIESIAKLIKDGKAKNIIVMTGAGISTSAGIPDFRSPKTGLYANLQRFELPYPEAIFDMEYFVDRPEPFYLLAKELYPGNFEPTPCHRFIKLLQDKGLLLRNFTQNIDTLERIVGIDPEKLVESHGSFHTSHCISKECRKEHSQNWIKEQIFKDKIPKCSECDSLVKPDITFFGEPLPTRFFDCAHSDFDKCDMLIVMGTSLQVYPFAALIDYTAHNVPRLLINREKVGLGDQKGQGFDFDLSNGSLYRRDAFYEGTCDSGCLKLMELLGWKDDLERLENSSVDSIVTGMEKVNIEAGDCGKEKQVVEPSMILVGGSDAKPTTTTVLEREALPDDVIDIVG